MINIFSPHSPNPHSFCVQSLAIACLRPFMCFCCSSQSSGCWSGMVEVKPDLVFRKGRVCGWGERLACCGLKKKNWKRKGYRCNWLCISGKHKWKPSQMGTAHGALYSGITDSYRCRTSHKPRMCVSLSSCWHEHPKFVGTRLFRAGRKRQLG